ncbi:MAG TPA: glucosaminidase domain-containing protein [Burkholderiaceae bacterium]
MKMRPDDFIAMMAGPAQATQEATGIPASFTIAQAATESGWMGSKLSRQANNLFGVKADRSWHGDSVTMPTKESINGQDVWITAPFRNYPDLATGLQDHANFLTQNPRYAPAFAKKDDSRAFTKAVADAHYASDPKYAETIIGIINAHNLRQYDTPGGNTNTPPASNGGLRAAPLPRLNPQPGPQASAGTVVAQRIKNALGGDTAAASSALRNAPVHVPGSQPTTAQVLAQDAKSPDMVLAEQAIANTPEGQAALLGRQNANNAARVDYVKKFAGTDEDLQDAFDARDEAAAPYLDKLGAAPPVDAQPVLDHLDALAKGRAGTDPDVKDAVKSLQAAIQDSSTAGPNGETLVAPDVLDGFRENVGSYLKRAPDVDSDVKPKQDIFAPVKDTIAGTIEDAVPGYADFLDRFDKDSVPINQMKLFRTLGVHDDSAVPNAAGDPTLTLDNVLAMAKKADNPDAAISPQGMDAVNNLVADLKRESISSAAAPNASGVASSQLGGAMSGGPAARGGDGALHDLLLNPTSAADALDQLAAQESKFTGRPAPRLLNRPGVAPYTGQPGLAPLSLSPWMSQLSPVQLDQNQ